MKRGVSAALAGLRDVVFPRTCVGCGGLTEHHAFRHVCVRCVSLLEFAAPPYCSTCGSPFYGELGGERVCPHCEGLQPLFREGRTAVVCKGTARSMIHELKYHGGLYVLHDIEEIFRRAAPVLDLVRGASLVPVPLHPRKARERGYNQSELLAHALLKAVGGSGSVEMLLQRTVDTASQTAFDRRTRLSNLKNAFALRPGASITAEHHYVLVDDVFTTGSTLNSCARVLRHAGVLNLDVVTFGHG